MNKVTLTLYQKVIEIASQINSKRLYRAEVVLGRGNGLKVTIWDIDRVKFQKEILSRTSVFYVELDEIIDTLIKYNI